MAVLGTRMLESRKRVGETAAAIELRQSGENSILNTVSLSISASHCSVDFVLYVPSLSLLQLWFYSA